MVEKPRLRLTDNTQKSADETHEASERMKALLVKGFGTRAIVCVKGYDKFNPKNWGIVIDTHPFSPYPLEVRMADGKGSLRSNGEDLDVIYRQMSKADLHGWFQAIERGLIV